jgi:hypothetical protein
MCIIHDWTKWSKQVLTYDGIYQYSYCKNKVKSYRRMGYNGCGNTSNLTMWNNPTSEADSHIKEKGE